MIINLGTNDGFAFASEDFRYERRGFEEAGVAFLKKVRHYNPKAAIVWVYGMLDNEMNISIVRAIDTYCRQTGDQKVFYLELPATTPETAGCREHPGVKNHRLAAEVLSAYLQQKI